MKSTIDWIAVGRDRDAGTSTKDLATKYGITAAAIYAHYRPKTPAHQNALASHMNGNGTSPYAGTIAKLTAQRDKLNAAIAALEAVA